MLLTYLFMTHLRTVTVGRGLMAENGVVYIGRASSYGVTVLDFVMDTAGFHDNGGFTNWLGGLGEVATPETSWGSTDATKAIVNNTVNDVAITVLAGAPTDGTTGLPVSTIAVGTSGGTSVINNDGTVTDSAITTNGEFLAFVDEGLWFGRDTGGHFATYADIAAGDGFGDLRASTSNGYSIKLQTRVRTAFTNFGNDLAHAGDVAPLGLQLTAVDYDGLATNSKTGMAAFITSDYNTGWMHGDIKGAWLSSTDDTDLVGTDLVTNGTFDTDTTGWTHDGSAFTVTTGVATLVADANYDAAQKTLTTVVGEAYVATADLSGMTSNGGQLLLGTSSKGQELGDEGGYSATSRTAVVTFVATGTTTYLAVVARDSGQSVIIDNVSVRLADPDRSVNGNGLATYGTITKTAVATGADLMAYSGFSASNYLEQPYNSDLDFGTGDFHVMGWINLANTAAVSNIIQRYTTSGNGGIELYIDASEKLQFRITANDWGSAPRLESSQAVSVDTWVFFTALRLSGTLYSYMDGVSQGSLAGGQDVSNTLAPLTVGGVGTVSGYQQGSLSLLRIGAGAPSADQIAKIYADELPLFSDNAACTLYGGSDAVTAIANDAALGLLHVGTSAGRSVFDGFERKYNTTDAASTTISVQGGLVGEK